MHKPWRSFSPFVSKGQTTKGTKLCPISYPPLTIDMTSPDSVPKIKIVVIGESSVGKTALIQRFCLENKARIKQITPTTGLVFREKTTTAKGRKLSLALWVHSCSLYSMESLLTSLLRTLGEWSVSSRLPVRTTGMPTVSSLVRSQPQVVLQLYL